MLENTEYSWSDENLKNCIRGENVMEERRRFGKKKLRKGVLKRLPPKPVKIGKEYKVDVTETSYRGEGKARIQGLVTFIPSTSQARELRTCSKFPLEEIIVVGE